ncbi:valine--pyruvate transaminase [Acaryochloris marina]|uniref:Valine--pyruvate aminotransferase n=1 Tax=Acaryochloris marina (strain MBIC 11017) TaxID=329726 RepID=B0CFM4_ACAM1|nr:valine--pyruvate transaminase [Acaryochloris marina]ABW27043.1 valine--pyruvate aminotransferase [Acaryochloris marina MBIC11017]BDM81809.1 valine--pyruvate transaminase [Acaryochloris marina MBIC10699]
MPPTLSQIGNQMSALTGVRAIMKDIIETLRANPDESFINLSAGNPVILPEVEQLWRDCTTQLLASPDYGEVVCRYGTSQGYQPLVDAIQKDFNQRYGLNLTDRQILITPGSQALYFLAANAFGGATETGRLKKIVLPLSPDYTGYGGICLTPEALKAYQPTLEIDETAHRFKYRPDFEQLHFDETTGCIIFSRPCNPTGNVLSKAEVKQIADLAAPFNIPVLIDSAYGPPYPSLNYTDIAPILGNNIVHCMSLSKAGLPGERVGIAIGDERIIQILEAFQTNVCIHSGRYGQAIAAQAIQSGALAEISVQVIRPYYQAKLALLQSTLDQHMPSTLPWFLHLGEGAIFAWLWLKELPISDWQLYQQLKRVGVIVVPGHSFFPGLSQDWPHKHQCLRISLTATDEEITIAMQRLVPVIEEVYRSNNA